ncbi:hypothetical protein [Streptomyces virginiae]|uniref:hypothetical protein n=1 Tax=Streptomyces virginiae TaxID=1961 RepID=UPI002253C007|nr:hypothetical protein [Streptomyces virginiae]MCX4718756.1 hypothetical protein [Streptomyces virginiae]MCX5276395.1 hypothetical protein [Streptomyces virginiae]
MNDSTAAGTQETENRRLMDTVATVPLLSTVGDLAALLARLPQDMPLVLDGHVRVADPNDTSLVHTITPRIVGVVQDVGTEASVMRPALELDLVYVPDAEESVQAAAAVRSDLPPHSPLARAEARLKDGYLVEGLLDAATVLDNTARLLGTTALDWMEYDGADAQALQAEADRIHHAVARLRALAPGVELPA